MTKDEKKELFLSILETWFSDYSGQINSDNCIGFYHYFLDCLDFEIQFSSERESEFYEFLRVIIDILTDFPSFYENKPNDKLTIKIIVLDLNKNINLENFDSMFTKLESLFLLFKDEYLL